MTVRSLLSLPVRLVVAGCLLLAGGTTASAQGLLWKLPKEEGKWVRFEGTYKQTVHRPNNAEGDLNVEWTKHITIKSLKSEEVEWRGEKQPGWWIEIKAVTGQVKEGILEAGPGGSRIYKLLVPEKAIRGTVTEEVGPGREIFVSYIPIVRGFRKTGDEAAVAIESGSFDLYPVVAQLRHYRDLMAGAEETVQTPLGDAAGVTWTATATSETTTSRITTSTELVRTDDPKFLFGVAKWTAKSVSETKPSTASRDEFQPDVEIEETMTATEAGDGAESEIADAVAATDFSLKTR